MTSRHSVAVAVVSSLAAWAGCAYDEPDIGSVTQAVGTAYLEVDDTIDDDNVYETVGSGEVFHFLSLSTPGAALYLSAQADITSSTAANTLDKFVINCDGSDLLRTTENHVGTGVNRLNVRMLYTPPVAPASDGCYLRARVKTNDGVPDGNHHTYLANGFTWFTASSEKAPGRWWRWGTENDATFDVGCGEDPSEAGETCTYVGETMLAGTSERVLYGPKFVVPSGPTSLVVYSDLELTTCYYNTASCDPSAYGPPYPKAPGSNVEVQLVAAQMCSASSSQVGKKTYDPPAGGNPSVFVGNNPHHMKVHRKIASVPISTSCSGCPGGTCTGRTFQVYTVLTNAGSWWDNNPIKVERGTGTGGYSTSFAFAQ